MTDFDPKEVLSDDEMNKLTKAIITGTREYVSEQLPTVLPPSVQILALTEKGLDALYFEFAYFDDETKRQGMAALGTKLADDGRLVIAATFISEGWMTRVDRAVYEQQEKDGTQVTPSQSPDRIETVALATMTFDNRTSGAILSTHRDTQGHMIRLDVDAITVYQAGTNDRFECAPLQWLFKGYAQQMKALHAEGKNHDNISN